MGYDGVRLSRMYTRVFRQKLRVCTTPGFNTIQHECLRWIDAKHDDYYFYFAFKRKRKIKIFFFNFICGLVFVGMDACARDTRNCEKRECNVRLMVVYVLYFYTTYKFFYALSCIIATVDAVFCFTNYCHNNVMFGGCESRGNAVLDDLRRRDRLDINCALI